MRAEQHMMIVQPASAWAEQARTALDDIKASNGGVEPSRIALAADINPLAFGRLIEALVALEPVTGAKVGEDLISLARLRPVDEVIAGGY